MLRPFKYQCNKYLNYSHTLTMELCGIGYRNLAFFLECIAYTLGYFGTAEVVEFADYGVPQRRQRLITIYSKNECCLTKLASDMDLTNCPRTVWVLVVSP